MDRSRELTSTSLSLFFFAFLPNISLALGLSTIGLHSHLNEPLEAEITIKDLNGLDVNTIKTTVGDPEQYSKLGLDPPIWLNQIHFEIIKKNGSENPILRLTTQQPIKEPFVDLVIEIAWPDGKLVREYTVLLDPPKLKAPLSSPKVLMLESQKNIKSELTQSLASPKDTKFYQPLSSKSELTQSLASAKDTPSSNSVGVSFGQQYGPINDEALWSIARKLVDNSTFSVNQAIMAIVKKNPQAFVRGNMNSLRKGAILNLPTKQELSQTTIAEAKQFVVSQKQNLQQGLTLESINKPIVETKLLSEPMQKSSVEIKPVPPKEIFDGTIAKPLKLVAPFPEDAQLSSKNHKNKLINGNVQEKEKSENPSLSNYMSQRLMLIEETIDTLKRSNEDIQQKNLVLQNQNESLASLLALKEKEIDKLKQGLQEDQSKIANVQLDESLKNKEGNEYLTRIIVDMSEKIMDGIMGGIPLADDQVVNLPHTQTTELTQTTESQVAKEIPATPTQTIAKKLKTHIDDRSLMNRLFSRKTVQELDPIGRSNALKADIMLLIVTFILMTLLISWIWFGRQAIRKKITAIATPVKPKNQQKDKEEFLERGIIADPLLDDEKPFDFNKVLAHEMQEPRELSDGESAEALKIEEAKGCIANEQYAQAEKILQECLVKNPHDMRALLTLLDLYVLTEKYHDFEILFTTISENLKETKEWAEILKLQEKVNQEKTILSQQNTTFLTLEKIEEESLPKPDVSEIVSDKR